MKRLLIITLIVSTLFISVSCAVSPNSPQSSIDTDETIEEVVHNEYLSKEEINARGHVSIAYEYVSEVSMGYNNADGSKTLYVYAQPVNYINESMEWAPIQTAIKEVDETRMLEMGYRYTIKASDIRTYYPEVMTPNLGIKLQKNLFDFGAVSGNTFDSEHIQKNNFIGNNRDMILYRDAIDGADMYVYPSNLGTNAEIEIDQPFAKNQFQLWVEIGDDMTIVRQPGGYLTIETKENDKSVILGVIQKPLLKDVRGNYSYDCSIRSVREGEDNRYIVTFTIDETMNQTGTNVFVAFEVRREKQPDNCLYSAKPSLTHAYLANYSVIGNSNEYGIGRLMLRYTLAPFAIKPEQIRSVTYELYALTNTGADIELVPVLEDWCSITGNWNNQYKTGEQIFQTSFADHVWMFDITESVKAWFGDESAQLEHNGLQLRYVNENKNESDIILSNDNSLYMNVTVINFD